MSTIDPERMRQLAASITERPGDDDRAYRLAEMVETHFGRTCDAPYAKDGELHYCALRRGHEQRFHDGPSTGSSGQFIGEPHRVPVFCPRCGAARTHDRLDGSPAYYCKCPGYGAGAEEAPRKVCLDPDKMLGAADQFGGSDFQ